MPRLLDDGDLELDALVVSPLLATGPCEWAATLATQPLPRGRRVVVFSTVGGWGVLAADACAAAGLDVIPLPDDVKAHIDSLVPARWSRNMARENKSTRFGAGHEVDVGWTVFGVMCELDTAHKFCSQCGHLVTTHLETCDRYGGRHKSMPQRGQLTFARKATLFAQHCFSNF